jgi:hypothetical protein
MPPADAEERRSSAVVAEEIPEIKLAQDLQSASLNIVSWATVAPLDQFFSFPDDKFIFIEPTRKNESGERDHDTNVTIKREGTFLEIRGFQLGARVHAEASLF